MSITTQIRLIQTTLAELGLKLPKKTTTALAERDTVLAAGQAYPIPTSDQIADALYDAVLDGRDLADDPELLRLAVARSLTARDAGLQTALTNASERRVRAALIADADTIMADMKKAVDKLGQTLAAAYAYLGDIELTDSAAAIATGPEAARHWADAKDAATLIERARRAWGILATATGLAPSGVLSVFILADVTPEQRLEHGRRSPNPWDLVRAGITIDLADRHTIRERQRRVEEALEDQHQRANDTSQGLFVGAGQVW